MLNGLVLVLAAVLLGGLLWTEYRRDTKRVLPLKAGLSLLFLMAAWTQPPGIVGYYRPVLVGLTFCLAGDVCLALPQRQMFLIGLISFLMGHGCYVLGFLEVAQLDPELWAAYLIVAAFSGSVFLWLRPHLGTMMLPVLAYVAVITVMVWGAESVLFSPTLEIPGRTMVFCGALAFYLSDLFVARDRFVKERFGNRLLGLPLYYGGQFLLAFSVGLVQ
jgi:uncharacterized membrane protein YhhN